MPEKVPFAGTWDFFRFVLPVILAVVGLQCSTQSFARMMNYDTAVVFPPMFYVGGYPFYNPIYYLLGIFKFIYRKGMYVYYLRSIKWFLFFGVLAFLAAVIQTAIINHIANSKNSTMNGTARLATEKELKQAGYMNKNGLVVGETYDAVINLKKKSKVDSQTGQKMVTSSLSMVLKKPGKLLCAEGIHALLMAPSGTGKNVSVILPTLFSWLKSVFVLDPKAENFSVTSKWRSQFSRIIRFDTSDKHNTLRFNPVNEIRDGIDCAYGDCLQIANIIIPPSTGDNAYFTNSAAGFVTSALLHLRFSDSDNKSLGGLRDFLSAGNEDDLTALLQPQKGGGESSALGKSQAEAMMKAPHYFVITQRMWDAENYQVKNRKTGKIETRNTFKDKGLHIGDKYYDPKLQQLLNKGAADILSTNAKEKASVWKEIASNIQLFDDENVRFATGESDFEIADFFNTDRPISFYFTVPFEKLSDHAPVVKIILTLILRRLTSGTSTFGNFKLAYDLLLILDEFPTLGKFPIIAEMMGLLRSYHVYVLIVCQALNQLVDRYGQNHPFLDHCQCHIIYAPGSVNDAEMYSRAIGNETIHEEKISRSGQLKIGNNNLSYSNQNSGRALFDAADIMRLPGDSALIRINQLQPYIAKKVVYYMDPRFKDKIGKEGLSIIELYSNAAGLPSHKRRMEMIKKNLLTEQSAKTFFNENNIEKDSELFSSQTELDGLLDSDDEIYAAEENVDLSFGNEEAQKLEQKESQNQDDKNSDSNDKNQNGNVADGNPFENAEDERSEGCGTEDEDSASDNPADAEQALLDEDGGNPDDFNGPIY